MNSSHLISYTGAPWQRLHQHDLNCRNSAQSRYPKLKRLQLHSKKVSEAKKKNFLKRDQAVKKGTISGAVALVIGTSIGSGILALPKKTSPAGLIPSLISMTLCWAILLIAALLLVEINVDLLMKKEINVEDDELKVISLKTMAEETLGEWGGSLATLIYVFLGYTSMVAYAAKSGQILHHLTHFPESISGVFFTLLFTILISVGGARATDQVNQWLTVFMIGLLLALEAVAVLFGGWSGFEGSGGDWDKVPATLPVMIFTLVYHDLAPVLCAYLGGDLTRIRTSVLLGSVVPLLTLLVWEAIALGLVSQANQNTDPLELLLSVRWEGVPFMVETFSLLAVGTSLIGTLLSFSVFFKEQLNIRPSAEQLVQKSDEFYFINNWWRDNKASIMLTATMVAPSLVVSTTLPDAFSAATDIAGGYCMAILYGVLPPVMAWAMNRRDGKDTEQAAISKTGPVLVLLGLSASGVVVEQICQDFSSFMHFLPH